MRHYLEALFSVTIHPDFDGERETFTVHRAGRVLTADSLPALWALLLEGEPVMVYDMRMAA